MKSPRLYLKIAAIALIFILLLSLIWFGPSWFDVDEESAFASLAMHIVLTLAVLLTGSLAMYVYYLLKQQKGANAETPQLALKEHLKQQRILFKQHVNEASENLKAAFQIWGNKRSRYLRKLPWYIVLGSATSGKTSLITNSGLDFSPEQSLGPDPLQAGDNHRDYIWRFSKEAVILDVASSPVKEGTETPQYTKWGIDTRDPFWAGVLKLIKRYRRQKPLNGAIVTQSLPELLLQSEKAAQTQRQSLKGIFQTVNQQLKIQTPLYLIFTKCDLIAGFQEFFADITKEDREQIWGVVFPTQPLANPQQAKDYFEKEYDKFIARLNERLLLRLEVERDLAKRMLISYFPQQMQLCRASIAEFILQDENIQLRGIYFVSNLQVGKPYDFLLSAVSAKYNLNPSALQPVSLQEKPFFLTQFFQGILLKEIDWVDNSPHLQKMRMLNYHLSWATAIFTLLFGIVAMFISYSTNKSNLESIHRYLPAYQQAVSQLQPSDKDIVDTLPMLNVLKGIQDIYNNAPMKWLLYFELYQPLKIKGALNEVWRHTLATQFMPRVALRLEKILKDNQTDSETLYQTLKGYLVFSPATNIDPMWLKPPIATDIAENLQTRPTENDQINDYLDQALDYEIDTVPLNEKVIEQTRNKLRKVLPVEFAYYEMKQEAARAEGQLTLSNKLGPAFTNIFNYENNAVQGVPALYTFTGYHNLHGKKSDLLVKHTAEIYWILGLDEKSSTNELVTQMIPILWSRYNNDYIHYWQQLLNNLHVVPFTNITQAIQILDLLTDLHSPLLGLLNIVKENTLPIHGKNLQIARHYSALNNVTGLLPNKQNPQQYVAILKNLTALRDYLSSINSSPNSAQVEFQDASAYLQNKLPNNPIALLKKQAQQMPAPLNRWLNEIADHSFNLLLQGAHQTINAAWQSNIAPAYQTNIQGRFPFNGQTDSFVNLTSFGEFFGNGGTLAQFFQTYLAPFIDTHHTPWRQNQIGSYNLGLSSNTVAQFEKAALIRGMYFQNGDKNPATQFSIQPRFLDPQSSSIYVQLANQNLSYRHGPQQSATWRWPMPSDNQQVNISFSDFQGQNFSRTFDGPWAWFKLLTTSQIQPTGAPGHYIWTIQQDNHQASFDLWAANNMPLFDLQVLKEFNLPTDI